MIAAERPRGVLRRQLILGDTPDTDRVQASYTAGVLTLRIPVAEKAKPRKIAINTAGRRPWRTHRLSDTRWPDTLCTAETARSTSTRNCPRLSTLSPTW